MELVVIYKGKESRYPFSKQGLSIGRGKENQVCLQDKNSSRQHCLIQARASGYWLEDLDSYNGTKVNGEKIKSCAVHPGDRIEIGKTLLILEEPSEEEGARLRGPRSARLRGQSRRRTTRRRVSQTGIWSTLLCVTMVLGALTYKVWEQYTFYKNKRQEYLQAVERMEQAPEQSREVFHRIVESLPGTKLAHAAQKNIELLQQGQAGASRGWKEFEDLQQQYQQRKMTVESYWQKLQKLAQEFPQLAREQKFQKVMEKVQQQYDSHVAEIFARIEQLADNLAQQGKYQQALLYYRNFLKKHSEPKWQQKARVKMEEIQRLQRASREK